MVVRIGRKKKKKKDDVSGYDVLLILGDSHAQTSSAIKNTVCLDILTVFIGIIFVLVRIFLHNNFP